MPKHVTPIIRAGAARPLPPRHLADPLRSPAGFEPAHELAQWIVATFIDQAGALHNEDHDHLESARLGVLWTNVHNSRGQRSILATAEMPTTLGGKWARARFEYQIEQWFGELPDFLLTFDAVVASEWDDVSFCALVEHELYHCAQAVTDLGNPRFRLDGTPIYALRGHDVEEFVGVVRRYGTAAQHHGALRVLIEAANAGPEIAVAQIAAACGNCAARRAA